MKNNKSINKITQTDNITTTILKRCDIEYWTYNLEDSSAVPGLSVMPELANLTLWSNFPQSLIDMGLIHNISIKEWLQLHERIKAGEPEITDEILVNEKGVPTWKKIQYYTDFDENDKPISAIGIAQNISSYKNLAKNHSQAAKQSGVTFWTFDFAAKTIYDFNNASHIKVFDGISTIQNVPEVFTKKGSPIYYEDIPAYLEMHKKLSSGAKTAKSISRWGNEGNESLWWYEIFYTTIFDENGKPIKAIGSAVDITGRVRLEARYNEELKWRKIHDKDVLGSFKLNLTQNICEDGQSSIPFILTFQGDGTVDDFFAHEYLAHVNEKDLAEYKNMFNRKSLMEAYREGKTNISQETYMSFWDRKVLWIKVELDMFQNPKTGDVEAYIYATDIDQKRTSKLLVEAVVAMDYDYLALLDFSNGAYTLFAQDSTKTTLPPFDANNYEYEVEQYARKYLVEEDIERNIVEMSYKNVLAELEKQDVYMIFCRIKNQDGSISHKKLQFTYLDKSLNKIILTRSDITDIYNEEQRKNEILKDALLAAQQASSAKSEFLSRMSHEIRTPMNTIIGMSTLASGCVNDSAQVSAYLSKVGLSARFLLSLINDILDMSRIESGKVLIRNEIIPFDEFINGVNGICYTQAEEKGVEYDAIITSFIEEEYIGDAMKLQQVLVNIASNAIKFTPRGGKVQLIIHQEKLAQDEALIKFTINDTGIGIDEKFIPKLFEPFEQQCTGSTTPYAGTGLGLAICKNLVDLMGGKITVNSIEGVGSEFVVEIKLSIPEKSNQTLKSKANVNLENLKALIVDDDIIICQHSKEILLDMNMQADYVISGKNAVEAVRSKWQRNEHYDIILVDWKMPNMDGIETTREIRKIVGPDVTIIIMTSYDWAVIEAEAKKAGVNLLISKPLFKTSLCSAFEKIYNKKDYIVEQDLSVDYNFIGKRVLLVEDHVLNIEVARKLLTAKHLEVDVAENGLQAIEIFAQNKDGYYDAILMDIRMPVMDGITATKSIRQMRKPDAKTIPIIAMTANAFDEDIEKTKIAGMNAHLAKPIEPGILYKTLQDFLN